MQTSDYAIQAGVRRVLARHWVDLMAIRLYASRGSIRFQGSLRRLGDAAFESSQLTVVDSIEKEVRRIRGVRRVSFDLSNWRQDTAGRWVERCAVPAEESSAADECKTFDSAEASPPTDSDG
jgi:hypothetical protein